MTNKVTKYCATLGLTGKITLEDVKKAYRRKMLEWHPDHHHGKRTKLEAHIKAIAINEAYEFLSEISEEHEIPSTSGTTARSYNQYKTRHTYRKRKFTPGCPDPNVFEVFLKSSWIVSAGYDPASHTLYLKFDRGAIYRCFNVPPRIFDELLSAESVGRFINQRIFPCYRHEGC